MEKRLECSENEIISMIQDTSQLVADDKINKMSLAVTTSEISNATAENVEFWNWMNRNYSGANGHMFADNTAMQNYIHSSKGKADWMFKQLQGKGYEWDWMQQRRGEVGNIFKQYSAGDVSNQPGFDVSEMEILSGKTTEYQMKAYTSKKNPDLHNTDKSIKVVTNAEKVKTVQNNGYEVESYKNREEILSDTNKRMKQIENGTATPNYNFKNVGVAMAKAGAVGCVIGMGTETVVSYRQWKEGCLSDEEYLKEIMKAGGDSGLTAAASAGIMIPISGAITAAGVTSLVTIPIAFVVGGAVNKVIAPCFGRGKYRQILGKAKYYQQLEDCYDAFIEVAGHAADEYINFVAQLKNQQVQHEQMKRKSMELNRELKNLYDSI